MDIYDFQTELEKWKKAGDILVSLKQELLVEELELQSAESDLLVTDAITGKNEAQRKAQLFIHTYSMVEGINSIKCSILDAQHEYDVRRKIVNFIIAAEGGNEYFG